MASSRLRVGFLFCAAALVSLSVSAQAPRYIAGQEDYLAPELRAKVERLKGDAARKRTDNGNVLERATVIWDWANCPENSIQSL